MNRAIITDKQIAKAERMLEAERKIIAALKGLKPEKRLPVLRASAILHGVEL